MCVHVYVNVCPGMHVCIQVHESRLVGGVGVASHTQMEGEGGSIPCILHCYIIYLSLLETAKFTCVIYIRTMQ